MKICDSVCIPQSASEDEDSSLTLVIPFNGVYTIDLQLAEFITDQERSIVTVRVPYPEVSDFKVEYENARLLDDSGITVTIDLREQITENKIFTENAAETARQKIISTIMALNPYEEVTVEVEFIN